jgi:hypothetical protein
MLRKTRFATILVKECSGKTFDERFVMTYSKTNSDNKHPWTYQQKNWLFLVIKAIIAKTRGKQRREFLSFVLQYGLGSGFIKSKISVKQFCNGSTRKNLPAISETSVSHISRLRNTLVKDGFLFYEKVDGEQAGNYMLNIGRFLDLYRESITDEEKLAKFDVFYLNIANGVEEALKQRKSVDMQAIADTLNSVKKISAEHKQKKAEKLKDEKLTHKNLIPKIHAWSQEYLGFEIQVEEAPHQNIALSTRKSLIKYFNERHDPENSESMNADTFFEKLVENWTWISDNFKNVYGQSKPQPRRKLSLSFLFKCLPEVIFCLDSRLENREINVFDSEDNIYADYESFMNRKVVTEREEETCEIQIISPSGFGLGRHGTNSKPTKPHNPFTNHFGKA